MKRNKKQKQKIKTKTEKVLKENIINGVPLLMGRSIGRHLSHCIGAATSGI
jgi:hypothetical protein